MMQHLSLHCFEKVYHIVSFVTCMMANKTFVKLEKSDWISFRLIICLLKLFLIAPSGITAGWLTTLRYPGEPWKTREKYYTWRNPWNPLQISLIPGGISKIPREKKKLKTEFTLPIKSHFM